jgi:hypothetical protein
MIVPAATPQAGPAALVARRTRRRGGELVDVVRVDEITGVRFVRELHPFPSYTGPELLAEQFVGQSGDTVLYCYVHNLYDG